ncbi:MAG TPA: hypothetical protein VHF22_09025, partial [Planctomycetota bacterium]|nr:hypothetical protein [Planctomycetota bacterium]
MIDPLAQQLIEYALQPGKEKDGQFLVDLCRKILKVVDAEKPTQRKFAAWLRTNQIYDRAFLQFVLRLCDVKIGAKATLGDAGEELAAEAKKGGAMPSVPAPGGFSGGDPDEDEDEQPAKTRTKNSQVLVATGGSADPSKDPFRALLWDRLVELNGYLCRFVLVEIGDGFLAPAEIIKRLGSSMYHGDRIPVPSFNNWLRWVEWLGYVKPVGFRHKLTDPGIEAFKYLKEIPEEELIEKGTLGVLAGIAEDEAAEEAPVDDRPFITAEDGPAGAAKPVPTAEPPAGAPKKAAPAPRAAEPEDDEDAGGDDLEDEGLDLPPEAKPVPAAAAA